MTELSFLLELLLNHKLPKVTREAVTLRIKEVEAMLSAKNTGVSINPPAAANIPMPSHLSIATQAPSTLAAMARNGFQEVPKTIPIEQIAQTPAAAAALASRQQAIQDSRAEKIDRTTGRPRKF